MSEKSTETNATAKPATTIAYCPYLDVYHFWSAEGADYFFSTAQLSSGIETYIKAGDAQKADFMAHLTAFARQYPLHRVIFYDDMSFKIEKLEAKDHLADEGDKKKVG